MKSVLEDRFGKPIPLHIWTRPPDSHVSENDFWVSLGLAIGFRYAPRRATRGDRRRLLVEFMIATAAACSSNFVALLIDEAQAMTFREWTWLLGLQNAMDWEGYRLSVFSIASHQMDYTYELLGLTDHAHVAARFLVAHWPFPGISSADEVEFVLKGYDEASEWPAQSGISYLAHFAPDAYARGARLARTAGFTVLVLAHLFNAFNARSDTTSAFTHLFTNAWLWGAVALSVLLQVAVVNLDFLNLAFGTVPLAFNQWLLCTGMASVVVWYSELRKLVSRAWSRRDGA